MSHFEAMFIHNPHDAPQHSHSATLFAMRDQSLLCTWYMYPKEEVKDAQIAIAIKSPQAHTWSKAKTIVRCNGTSPANPVIFEGLQGRLHLMYVVLKGKWWDSAVVYQIHSDDGGITWSSPKTIIQQKGMMIRHAPVHMRDGSYLLPAYDEASNHPVIFRAEPPHDHWEPIASFPETDLIQPVLVLHEKKSLALFLRPCGDKPRFMFRSFSSDEGKTWSNPIQTTVPNPYSGIAAFGWGERIGAVYNPHEHKRYPLALSITRNVGVNWQAPITIDNSDFEVSYPSFLIDDKEVVHGVYTYNRRMIKYVSFNQEWIKEKTHENHQ